MAAPSTLGDELVDGADVAFDANSLIYFIERSDELHQVVRPVLSRVSSGGLNGHASVLTLLEVLVLPLRNRLDSVAAAYRNLLGESQGFSLHPLDLVVAEQAASLGAKWNLRSQDAVVAATALESGCTHLITNDSAFRRITELKVLVIGDYV